MRTTYLQPSSGRHRAPLVVCAALVVLATLVACGGASGPSLAVTDVWSRPEAGGMGAMGAMGDMTGMAVSGNDQAASFGIGTPEGMDSAPLLDTNALYLTIQNRGGTADQLIGVQTDIAQAVELHRTVTQNGISQMNMVKSVDIPANGKAEFKPGGNHIMLIGLTREMKPGETFLVTLQFAKSAPMTVNAEVRQP